MSLRCAVYARYSSDQQSPSSIEDQLRRCREYATKQGWDVVPEHVYTDEGLSGSGADRPGWVRLRSAINRTPRFFEVLLVDDTSRLSRNLGESSAFLDEVRFREIRVVAISQGIDTQNKQAKLVMTIHGLQDEAYIEELATKTHRGLEGRALKASALAVAAMGMTTCRNPMWSALTASLHGASKPMKRKLW
ncbi:MAG: recombinase family protein [Ignavibacteriota bacterium]